MTTDLFAITTDKAPPAGSMRSLARFELRRLPYPYRAMLAICSDLDETPDRHVYWETMRFLNTTEATTMGNGVGLEVGNTIYFDMPPDQFAYWNTDDTGRTMVRNLIRSGYVDCLHSFGDLATTREHAGRALEELERADCRMAVWIDHGVAASNFGADIMQGCGDVPNSPVYHADLTHSYGIRYVWRGRVTSVIGQNATRSLNGIYNRHHPIASTKTAVKEFLKAGLPWAGQGRYAMHMQNLVLREIGLRSGQTVNEFLRANPHWGGVSRGDTAEGIHEVLTEAMLNRLMKREGMCILYTHLGKIRRREEPFGPQARNAFRRLAAAYHQGRLLVTTTRRLLDYCQMLNSITVTTATNENCCRISVSTRASGPVDYSGLSFYVADPEHTEVDIDGKQTMSLQRNPADHTRQMSVSIPWRRLGFPKL